MCTEELETLTQSAFVGSENGFQAIYLWVSVGIRGTPGGSSMEPLIPQVLQHKARKRMGLGGLEGG